MPNMRADGSDLKKGIHTARERPWTAERVADETLTPGNQRCPVTPEREEPFARNPQTGMASELAFVRHILEHYANGPDYALDDGLRARQALDALDAFVASSPVGETRDPLAHLRGLERDWDSYDGLPPYEQALAAAETASWVPVPAGGVQWEISAGGAHVEVEIGPDGAVAAVLVEPSSLLPAGETGDGRAPCSTCGGRGWHTAGGNDPAACSCAAGDAFETGDGRERREWTLHGFPSYMGPPLVIDGPEITKGVKVRVREFPPEETGT